METQKSEKQQPGARGVLMWTLLSLCVCSSAMLWVYVGTGNFKASKHFETDKYVLYIGLNDKDLYTQIVPTDEARKTINSICSKYVEGFTVLDAQGGWFDEKENLTKETTLVYQFTGADWQQIAGLMNEVLEALNQNSILVEVQHASWQYYDGK